MAGYNLQSWQEQRVLRFLNNATAAEIQRVVVDDPNFGSGSPLAYGVRAKLASRILARRAELSGAHFSHLAEVDALFGMGPDTFHDLLAALLPVSILDEIVRRLQAATRVVVVTGAGVSVPAPSNIQVMAASDLESQWTPQNFARYVQAAWEFHLGRRDAAALAQPNAAHADVHALAQWVLNKPGVFTLVTQNQDRLHHLATSIGSRSGNLSDETYPIIELHGDVFHGRCGACGEVFLLPEDLDEGDLHTLAEEQSPRYFICATCHAMARPTVQWLTEPYERGVLDVAGAAVLNADVVMFLGTSGCVPVVRWLLHEAHWHARAYTVVAGTDPAAWVTRDGTPAWPGHPIVDATITGDIVDVMGNLRDAVGW